MPPVCWKLKQGRCLFARLPITTFATVQSEQKEDPIMLWTITVILFVLWILGMVSGAALGWWVHFLLVLAVISLIFAVLRQGSAAP